MERAWHERPGAFERLSPPWQSVRIVERRGGIRDGARVTLDLGAPIGRWELEHHDYAAGVAFHDRQLRGPFAHYRHAHRFRDEGAAGVLTDALDFALPLAPLSSPAEGFVRDEFARLFAWRHRVTRFDLDRIGTIARGTPRQCDVMVIAGTITAYDNFVGPDGKKGGYGVSFWSTDVVRAPMILEAYNAISGAHFPPHF